MNDASAPPNYGAATGTDTNSTYQQPGATVPQVTTHHEPPPKYEPPKQDQYQGQPPYTQG